MCKPLDCNKQNLYHHYKPSTCIPVLVSVFTVLYTCTCMYVHSCTYLCIMYTLGVCSSHYRDEAAVSFSMWSYLCPCRQPLSMFHEEDYCMKLPRNRRKSRLYLGFSCNSWLFLLLALLQGESTHTHTPGDWVMRRW